MQYRVYDTDKKYRVGWGLEPATFCKALSSAMIQLQLDITFKKNNIKHHESGLIVSTRKQEPLCVASDTRNTTVDN